MFTKRVSTSGEAITNCVDPIILEQKPKNNKNYGKRQDGKEYTLLLEYFIEKKM